MTTAPTQLTPEPRLRSNQILVLAVGIVLVWAAIVFAADPSSALRAQVSILARNVAAGLFLAAGVIRFAIWRLDGSRESAESAAALGAFAVALPVATMFGAATRFGPIGYTEAPLARLILVVPLLVLVVARARHSRRLSRLSAVTFAFGTCTACVGVYLTTRSNAPVVLHPRFWLAVEALVVGAWCALALQSVHRARFLGTRTERWLTIALACLIAADATKAWSVMGAHEVSGLSSGFQLTSAIVVLSAAMVDVWSRIRDDSASADISRALVDTERRLIEVEQLQRERLHDARSAVLGVVGASELLTHPERTITVDPRTLRELVAEELHRLQGLLDVNDDEPVIDFDLASAAASVVLARRLDGMTIDLAWRDARVVGRPRATATAIDNLLRNAHRHAPGARVLISARQCGPSVEIVVSDDGPGIAAAERDRVLRPGVRGSRARGEGSGLGLYSAAKTMAAQSGSLEIGESACGGTKIVLRLPASVPLYVPMHPVAS